MDFAVIQTWFVFQSAILLPCDLLANFLISLKFSILICEIGSKEINCSRC